MTGDPVTFGKELAAIIKSATAPLLTRIEELEQRAPKPGPAGEDAPPVTAEQIAKAVDDHLAAHPIPAPADGRAPTPEEIAEAVKAYLVDNPPPAGESGPAGESVDHASVAEMVATAVAALPAAEPGKDGDAGRAPTPEEIDAAVAAYLTTNPPADGAPGKDAPPVEQTSIEKAVADHLARFPIPPGRDGQPGQPGRDGAPGEKGADGVDGFSADDLDLVLGEDGRTVTVKLMRGERVIEKSIRLPVLMDQGVYSAGKSYEIGDCVSFGGNLWTAKAVTKEAPGTSPDWRLAVRRGRDGRTGPQGPQGERGLKGQSAEGLTR